MIDIFFNYTFNKIIRQVLKITKQDNSLHNASFLYILITKKSFKEREFMKTSNIELENDEDVKKFVGEYHPEHYLLNKKEPMAIGPLDLQAYLFEHKAQQGNAMKASKQVILDVSK